MPPVMTTCIHELGELGQSLVARRFASGSVCDFLNPNG